MVDPLTLHKINIDDKVRREIRGVIPFYDKLICDNVIIAGGFPTHLTSTVIRETSMNYSDVDIFINNIDVLKTIFQYIIRTNRCHPKIRMTRYINEFDYSSIINIDTENDIHYQLIYTLFDNVEHLLNSFDLDYCQCAIYGDKLCYTEQARVALETGISKRYSQLKCIRLYKLIKKDMVCEYDLVKFLRPKEEMPIMFKRRENEYISDPNISRDLVNVLQPMKLPKTIWFDFDDIRVIGLRAYDIKDNRGVDIYDNSVGKFINFVPIISIYDEIQPHIKKYGSYPPLIINIRWQNGSFTILDQMYEDIDFDNIYFQGGPLDDGDYKCHCYIHGILPLEDRCSENKFMMSLNILCPEKQYDAQPLKCNPIPLNLRVIWWDDIDISDEIKLCANKIISPNKKSARF